jgi:hypothetical protein
MEQEGIMAQAKTTAHEEHNTKQHPEGNAAKDPHDWVTGDEPMTGAQASYLRTLCEETGEEFDDSLSKGDASLMIDRLKGESPRLKGE